MNNSVVDRLALGSAFILLTSERPYDAFFVNSIDKRPPSVDVLPELIKPSTMMDEEGGRGGRLGGALGSLGAPPMAGIGGAGAMGQLSPYLNIDPAYLSTETPQFIHNDVSSNIS